MKKARERLEWQPKRSLDELVAEMLTADVVLFQKDKLLREAVHEILTYKEF